MFPNGVGCVSAGYPRARLRARPALLCFLSPLTQGDEVSRPSRVIASVTMDINSNSSSVKAIDHAWLNPLLTSYPAGAHITDGTQNPLWDSVMQTQLAKSSTLPDLQSGFCLATWNVSMLSSTSYQTAMCCELQRLQISISGFSYHTNQSLLLCPCTSGLHPTNPEENLLTSAIRLHPWTLQRLCCSCLETPVCAAS